MAATGSIVTAPLAAADALNATAIPSAEAGYTFMMQILGNEATPLIFASLALSGTAIVEGLFAYEAVTALARKD
ncbi:hypothetical protein HDE76_000674 [Rhodanobacter sp. ANJX3]|jgi:hypothetical protein|uniref:hypothetical protein n=1 Tax=unclassified Rhodanobacter TaxID=2621553 RepID=UPI0015CC4B39|nr:MULTISPECIES: hypothetical protein [unclassified Rhodanobacter]MBB5357492.1 hypothetical protein [Rhodanobacter sp. ANJX3]NYE27540.1 hypothetical protein [Rhodanobacter sp. K2T2]